MSCSWTLHSAPGDIGARQHVSGAETHWPKKKPPPSGVPGGWALRRAVFGLPAIPEIFETSAAISGLRPGRAQNGFGSIQFGGSRRTLVSAHRQGEMRRHVSGTTIVRSLSETIPLRATDPGKRGPHSALSCSDPLPTPGNRQLGYELCTLGRLFVAKPPWPGPFLTKVDQFLPTFGRTGLQGARHHAVERPRHCNSGARRAKATSRRRGVLRTARPRTSARKKIMKPHGHDHVLLASRMKCSEAVGAGSTPPPAGDGRGDCRRYAAQAFFSGFSPYVSGRSSNIPASHAGRRPRTQNIYRRTPTLQPVLDSWFLVRRRISPFAGPWIGSGSRPGQGKTIRGLRILTCPLAADIPRVE